jgi:ABC-type branched-subunit amino acid transport system permease subunit
MGTTVILIFQTHLFLVCVRNWSPITKGEQKLKLLQIKELRNIAGPKRVEINRKLMVLIMISLIMFVCVILLSN